MQRVTNNGIRRRPPTTIEQLRIHDAWRPIVAKDELCRSAGTSANSVERGARRTP
jgi:hypothetical protein